MSALILSSQKGQALVESLVSISVFIAATTALMMLALLVENGMVARYRLYEATVCTQYFNEDPKSQLSKCRRLAELDLKELVLLSTVTEVHLETQQNRAVASVLIKLPWRQNWQIEESIALPLPYGRNIL
jgi:hypothetical protein